MGISNWKKKIQRQERLRNTSPLYHNMLMCQKTILMTELKSDLEDLDSESEKVLEIP